MICFADLIIPESCVVEVTIRNIHFLICHMIIMHWNLLSVLKS